MILKLNKKTGQTALEYSILLIIILGVFVAMGTYVKRAFQGRWKSVVDDMGDQYDPRFSSTETRSTISVNSETRIFVTDAGDEFHTERQDISNSFEEKSGFTTVTDY